MAASSSQDYSYVPLSGLEQIRVLRLLKSKSPEDPLQGELFERPLHKAFPTYETVSYTWGGQQKDHYIYIDGKRLSITKNCSELLFSFRNPRRRDASSRRRLWVDSICINQQDEDEKCAQVEIMHQIYQRSSQVLIWLGQATPESDLLFQNIRRCTWQWWNPLRSKKKAAQIIWDIEQQLLMHPEWILDLVARPWFTRVWTIQEASSAMFGVLRCGKEKLLIGTLFTWYRQALNGVSEVYYNIAALLENIERFTLHFRVRIGVHRTLLDFVPAGFYQDFSVTELMRDVRLCGAFEPKDKIFALHGLLQRGGIILPPVDYKRSLNEIYYTATLQFLKNIPKKAGALQLIALVTGRQSGRSDPHLLPSWVPDYSDQLPPYQVFDNNGNVHRNGMEPDFHFSQDHMRLCMPAVVVDRVHKASRRTLWHPDQVLVAGDNIIVETLKTPTRAQKTILALQEWIRLIAHFPNLYEPTHQSKQEAFFATIGAHRGATNIHMQVNRIASLRQKRPNAAQLRKLSEDLVRHRTSEPISMVDILAHLYKYTFEGDAKTWWSIIMANDPAYPGLNRDALFALLASTVDRNFNVATLRGEVDEWLTLLTLDGVLPGLCESIITACRGNTFFCTEAGYMGAGTNTIFDGDLIVYIGGLDCPMAVRRCSDGHKLIGPVHVHGIMNGELWPAVSDIYRSKNTSGNNITGGIQRYYCDLELI
ncbi:HET-domain-containing protein [Xylariaceae sp. AK1471]|nr:HET-domain-containing protein [Xylariaceae sp. AK1471]